MLHLNNRRRVIWVNHYAEYTAYYVDGIVEPYFVQHNINITVGTYVPVI